MAFSLESRAPLLDYRIIEHAVSVPGALKMSGLTMKRVLREAVRDLLPSPIYARNDKMGMPTPTALWFRGELSHWVEQCLTANPSGLLALGHVEQALQRAPHRHPRPFHRPLENAECRDVVEGICS